MALRAGYYGLKGSVKKALEKLLGDTAGMKVIKSVGDGLNLTSAGKLNLTAATAQKLGGVKVGSGLEINDGVLNCTVTGGFDYSTTEFDTGQKWIDGSAIYGIVLQSVSIGSNAWGSDVDTGVVIDKLIDFFTISADASGSYIGSLMYAALTAGTTTSIKFASPVSGITSADVAIFYTKTV